MCRRSGVHTGVGNHDPGDGRSSPLLAGRAFWTTGMGQVPAGVVERAA